MSGILYDGSTNNPSCHQKLDARFINCSETHEGRSVPPDAKCESVVVACLSKNRMSFKHGVVFWLQFALISFACQARLLRMTNQLTSAAVANARYIGFDYLLATSVSNAQYILPSFCEQCEGEFVTVQIPNQPEFSATPTVPPFVSTMSVVSVEYDEANQLLLMVTFRPSPQNIAPEIFCHSFNLLSNQEEDFSELSTPVPEGAVSNYTLGDAICVLNAPLISASTISSTLASPTVRGATSYAIAAVISWLNPPYNSLTLVAIANQSDPDNPPYNINMTSIIDLQFHSGSYVERVEVTSNSFSVDNQAPFVAVVYATDDGTVHTHLQQIDTSESPPAFDLHSYLDHLGPFPWLEALQLATQPTSRTDWVVFILLSNSAGPYHNSSLYSFTVTSCVSASCPHTCSGTPCFIVNGGRSSPPNFIASWSSQQVPILSANKFSILDMVDASIVYTDTNGNIIFWETDENGTFPVEEYAPTLFREVFPGPQLYDVANNNVGGFIVGYGKGDGRLNLAIRCNSTTEFLNDVIYYDDLDGSPGFAAVALSNSCNNGYVGAFAAAPVNNGGGIALYSAPAITS